MPSYRAPLRDMRFVMFELLDAQTILNQMPAYVDLDADTINAVLEEGAKFAENIAFPLNQSGDLEGCTFHGNGVVTTPKGFKEAYRQFSEAGWPALSCDVNYGGQGLPRLLNNRLYEMMNSANQAWLMYSGLSHSAYECLIAHGTQQQKDLYLPKIVSGQWSGTMCLTEPHCGTDLGLLKTKVEPSGDGSFTITGTKIFITSGEHDVAENILHLVLARLPDAPAGSKGISLFLVPKFIPDANGDIGERNSIFAGSIEHKMGIHGNATCVMNMDAARGWLIGEPNKGLAAMFVMMNSARLGVGMQSLGLAETAHQNATAYAKDRLQGRSMTGIKNPDKAADPILVHPDVRRMLLTSRAYTEAGRALTTWIALLIDQEESGVDAEIKKYSEDIVSLLTPVVKAFITDNAFETTNLCVQVFGGHGYIREWGMEQYVRDARINMIYEGTNGIQALDLLGRKVLADHGEKLSVFMKIIVEFIDSCKSNPAMQEFIEPLSACVESVQTVTKEIAINANGHPDEIGAAAVPYLRLIGHLSYAWMWARMASVSLQAIETKSADHDFYHAKLLTARFYYTKLLPESLALIAVIKSGAAPIMDMELATF
ncbi:MAG: acyl-CoA dehydrogenase C-terminal domain-containing protein [Arenimonas sp.]